MCLLGNITTTEAKVRQNTGKEKQSKKELPDIQTGSFHTHYCIFKRQVLTAHFCSAREGRVFFFFFLVLFKISAWMFLFSFQQMDKQMGTTARRNVEGERGSTVRLGGLASLGLPVAVLRGSCWNVPVNLAEWVDLEDLVTGTNKHNKGWLHCRDTSWLFVGSQALSRTPNKLGPQAGSAI